MLNNGQKPERSVARDDDSSTIAGFKKLITINHRKIYF